MHRAQRLAKSVPSDCYEHFRLKKSHYHRRWLNWLGNGINNSFIGNKEADGTRLVLIVCLHFPKRPEASILFKSWTNRKRGCKEWKQDERSD